MDDLTIRVGDISVTRVFEIELTLEGGKAGTIVPGATIDELERISWVRPAYVTDDGGLKICVQAFLIETPTARIVVDTCIGYAKHRAGGMYDMLDTPFLARFAEAGSTPSAVDIVICTHLHLDHVGWNTTLEHGRWVPTFANARYKFGRTDYEYYSSLDDAERKTMLADSVDPILDAGLADLIETNASIVPGVRLISTPGHSPGHASVVIESRNARAIISGDVFHHPSQLARPDWSSTLDYDQDASRLTRRAFLEDIVDSDTLLIGTHFPPPTAGRVVREGDGYRFVGAE